MSAFNVQEPKMPMTLWQYFLWLTIDGLVAGFAAYSSSMYMSPFGQHDRDRAAEASRYGQSRTGARIIRFEPRRRRLGSDVKHYR